MRVIGALATVLMSLTAVIVLMPNAMAAEASPAHKPALSAMQDCGDSIHAFRKTGQPMNKWLVRVVGPDLIRTIGSPARAEADISIDDAGGTRTFTKPFDQHSPLNAIAYMNGDAATITVDVRPTPPNGNGCRKTMVLKHL